MCTCDKIKKVPQNERIFLQDQRSCRKMAIGPVDITAYAAIRKKIERIMKTKASSQKYNTDEIVFKACTVDASNRSISSSLSDSNSSDADDHEEEFIAPLSTVTVQPSTSQILRHPTSMVSMRISLQ